MLSTGRFQLPWCSNSLLTIQSNSTASSLSLPYRTHRTHLAFCPSVSSSALLFTAWSENGVFLSSLRTFCNTHFNSSADFGHGCNGFRAFALKKHARGEMELLDMDSFDDDYDDDDDEEEEEEFGNGDDFEEDDEDGTFFLPFGRMKKWLENKPRGFGEGKVYDTSIEDKLFEEMEQSRQAQDANINKLKKNPAKPSSKQDEQKKKAKEVVPSGIQVQVVNLPKKKNVHRDLKSAFKGVPGIISINPVVSGNKKTRDPICKGSAFIYFKSEEEANRFIQMFSRQSISFGKVQKEIKCEIVKSQISDSAIEQSADRTYTEEVPEVEGYQNGLSDMDDSSLEMGVENRSDEYDEPNDNFDMQEPEDVGENLESITASELSDGDSLEQRSESESSLDLVSLKRLERIEALEKKLLGKGMEEKVPSKGKGEKIRKKKLLAKGKEVKDQRKLGIPGSAKRLKIKEKAVLTDVFSKYGTKSAMASKEER
ncbi:uncharacterized protein LOC107419902 [Ziziphus jujuba]|uniref:Uncharacterized protein LOC107419902 n=1 Tax=Ziziphus jujuba TaxID=326968 RepID=A0A6P4AER0_ZIZJJ|nr:uncharacterized protein LOC107419902 [Ziziphus jujuba]